MPARQEKKGLIACTGGGGVVSSAMSGAGEYKAKAAEEQRMTDLYRRCKFPTPVERAKVAADWRDRGYSCALFVDPPGRAWTDFVHASNELVAVAEGRLEVTVRDIRMVAEPGDEVFIPKGARHSVRNIHRDTTQWLYGYD